MIQIIALLYAGINGVEGLRAFESQVIPILREYNGTLISASYNANEPAGEPDEIHVIQFPSVESFEAYKNDDRIVNLSALKAKMIRKMDIYITTAFLQY
ncbi:DUF1330 domain-containing protein [Agaribacter marinus]|uniref:DUF1330 domain-containing protein n=1 Tax=Agaribacter marinus TaxID=1431249 RepID=A0AA37SUR0_9ALTE|nr:DUF1330 domain-containing protein [Agaribacter marinus]GLR69577.1 hypothetical protein GCM10007852_04850 [Agaribacter marinus]